MSVLGLDADNAAVREGDVVRVVGWGAVGCPRGLVGATGVVVGSSPRRVLVRVDSGAYGGQERTVPWRMVVLA